jgi:hypothetical protein
VRREQRRTSEITAIRELLHTRRASSTKTERAAAEPWCVPSRKTTVWPSRISSEVQIVLEETIDQMMVKHLSERFILRIGS